MSDAPQDSKLDHDQVIELARYELDYRRKKQWDIFSWVVTILVSVIGGLIALTWKGEIKPDLVSRTAMAFALVVLTVYAIVWIRENLEAEKHADEAVRTLLRGKGLEVDVFRKSSSFPLGYVGVVLLIGIAAVVTVLFVNKPA